MNGPQQRWWLWALAAVAAALLIYALRNVVAPVFFAFLVAYMLDPVVDRIEERGFLRGSAIAVLLAAFFIVGGVVALVVAPAMITDIAEFWRGLPDAIARMRVQWDPWLAERGIAIPTSVSDAMERLHLDFGQLVEKGAAPVSGFIKSVAGGTASVLGTLFAIVTVPIFAFYLLYDFDDMVAAAGDLVPRRYKASVFSMAKEIDEVLGQFFRGQVTVMLVLAVLYAVGYSIVGVPLAIPIAIVAGLISFVPYLGGATALGLALVMCFLQWQGWPQIFWVVVVYSIVQALEGFVITPKIMGDKVGLSALVVLLALLVGGELLGLAGVLLAVPTAAVLKIFVARAVTKYRQSELYSQ